MKNHQGAQTELELFKFVWAHCFTGATGLAIVQVKWRNLGPGRVPVTDTRAENVMRMRSRSA
jgi:hypothetical protein